MFLSRKKTLADLEEMDEMSKQEKLIGQLK